MVLKDKISGILDRNKIAPGVIAGLITVLVFKIVLGFFPENFYLDRDDGIITLSHAKNLTDFGFIGVNPSGERVEGFSSPLQFLIFSVLSSVYPFHYSVFFAIQWWITTFLFGFVIFSIFEEFYEKDKIRSLGLVLCASALLSVSFTFLAWHASGMENSWVHLLYLSYALILFKILNGNSIAMVPAALILFAAMIVRIESVYHLFLISFVFLFLAYKKGIHWKETLPLWIAGVLWALFFIGRILYFGNLFPNTSTAQEVSLSENLNNLIRLNPALLKNWEIFRFGFKQNLVLLLPVSLALLFLKRISSKEVLLTILASALALPGLLHAFVLGNYRLDPARPMTWLACVGTVLFLIRVSALTEKRKIWILPIVLLAGFVSYKNYKFKSYDLCCSSGIFEQRRLEILNISQKEEIIRPLVAIADLGAVSFYKEFNILDLGYLGNRFLAKNKKNSSAVQSYLELNRPDVLEVHFPWSCEYSKVLNHIDFERNYRLVLDSSEKPPIEICPEGGKVVTGTFLYRGMDRETKSEDREVYSSFLKDPSLKVLKSELKVCDLSPFRCRSRFRNIYRFLPELKKNIQNSEWNEAAQILSNPHLRDYLEVLWRYGSPSETLVEEVLKVTLP
ncbi:hypothetical protein [Leptospira barantonii]|uniref:Glycosyltransferase RgtA/B/C/D-like domain-containing protein n=1 Tax=Leptospira barantonii TaxID=2023184 RepID=A0ABX4NR44_9LEPT|nr:hypothetical protein [Leptospira barantonii]PJZ58047.1 hypothetical protein CH367_06555 [Leptospira barantonii]